MTETTRLGAIDRIESTRAVFVFDDGETVDLPLNDLPSACRAEGAVLRVNAKAGKPDWGAAERDRDEEKRRIAQLKERVDRLKRGDSGGDLDL